MISYVQSLAVPRILLDSDVLVAAMLGAGAASRLVGAVLEGRFEPLMGPALYAEHEAVLGRERLFARCRLSAAEREELFDIYLAHCRWTKVYYLWRPNLRDEADNHLVELAVAGGAQAIFGITPDLTCLGKIIGGGLPVGAYGGRAELMDLVAPAGPVYQAGTLSGNPVAMTAGLWALKRLTSTIYKELARRGSLLAAGLAAAARGARVPLQVNAFGSLITPFFTASPVRDYESALAANTNAYATFFRAMLARGVYPPPSQFEAWFLSAAHTDRHIKKTIDAARAAMREVARAI